jgi:hypothetical protein
VIVPWAGVVAVNVSPSFSGSLASTVKVVAVSSAVVIARPVTVGG